MGCKAPSGLPFLLIAAGLLAFTACVTPTGPADPEKVFTPSGVQVSRELGVYAGERRVGDMHFTVREGSWEGREQVVELAESVLLRLSFRGDTFTVRSNQTAWVQDGTRLLASSGTMDFGAGVWETKAVLVGEGEYQRTQGTKGSVTRDRISVPVGVMPSEVIPLYLHRWAGPTGERRDLKVFNMVLGQELPLTVAFAGREDDGRLFRVSYWGMEEKIWLDDEGMVAREEMAIGVQARPPGAGDAEGALALESVLTQTAVPASGIPEDLGRRGKAVLVLEGSFREPPQGRWQEVRMEGDRAVVSLTRPLPPPEGRRAADGKMMPADALGLDLDSPRIRELARQITGDLSDPWEKAAAVGRWVHERLGKSMRECFSALQVLEAGEGECQSHSLLAVSLSRAAGVPARFAYGVVYMPERDAFLFHTWVEVHVGEWVPMDPTLGNFPAGVDHLTLAVGGYRDQFRLFPYIMGRGGWRVTMTGVP
ncbi:MAG: transglutaminase domain-containing protein [bacterium]|nr:MAG: transglutaminase domain-containing protein [bacterium]